MVPSSKHPPNKYILIFYTDGTALLYVTDRAVYNTVNNQSIYLNTKILCSIAYVTYLQYWFEH